MKNPFSFIGKAKSFASNHSLFLQTDLFSFSTKISPKKALEFNQKSLYVNKGFEKRAEKVSEVEFILLDRKGEIIKDNKELDLLNNPNPDMTGKAFWKLATQYRDITGMAVIRKHTNGEVYRENQKIEKLELLNSAYVQVIEDTNTGKIKSFRYSNPNKQNAEEIPYQECIYWYIPDPLNTNQPLPLLLAGLLSMETALEADKQYNATIKNGGSVDGLFKFKENLSEEKVNKLKEDYARLLRDNKDANVPMVLTGDASFERVALSPHELQSIDNKKLLLEDLLAITGVPKSLLGLSSSETYANADTSYRIFLRETIKPIVENLVDILNWKLISDDYTLDYIDPTPDNVEENLKKLEIGSRVQAYTLNEKRELLGLEPVKDGDEIEKEQPVIEQQNSQKKNLNFNHPLKNEEYRDKYYENFLKGVSNNKKLFRKELLKFLEGQKERVLENIPRMKKLKSMTKAEFEFDVLNEPLEISYMNPIMKVMEEIAKDEGKKTAAIFNQEFFYTSEVEKMVDKRFEFFATTINATTANVLKEEFSDWFENDETVSDLSKRISNVYDFEKSEKWRADMIVNTEVSTVTNMTKGETYKQLDIPVKIWVHRPGVKGGVRDDHAFMDGEEVKMAQRFSNGMLHPHDPAGGAGEVINCMCTW